MEPHITEEQQGHSVTGLFTDRNSMEQAYNTVSARGYGKDDVNLLMSEQTRKNMFPEDPDAPQNTVYGHIHTTTEAERGDKALEGAGAGGIIGGGLGVIIAAVAAAGTNLIIPGMGIIVAGPLAAALAGAGAGSIAGGLIGSLIGAGISEDKAIVYDKGIREGKVLMSVKTKNKEDAEYIREAWHTHYADNH